MYVWKRSLPVKPVSYLLHQRHQRLQRSALKASKHSTVYNIRFRLLVPVLYKKQLALSFINDFTLRQHPYPCCAPARRSNVHLWHLASLYHNSGSCTIILLVVKILLFAFMPFVQLYKYLCCKDRTVAFKDSEMV